MDSNNVIINKINSIVSKILKDVLKDKYADKALLSLNTEQAQALIADNIRMFINNPELYNTKKSSEKKKDKLDDDKFWSLFNKASMNIFEKRCKYMFIEFGTTNRCNRFDVGNCIEFFLSDVIESIGLSVKTEPNASRIDLVIKEYCSISVKYSSTGNIKLHNSLGQNKDMKVCKTLVIKPNMIYLISSELLKKYNIDIKNYLINTGDGLSLKNSLITYLNKIGYKYCKKINIGVDKNLCKHRMCSQVIAQHVKDIVD